MELQHQSFIEHSELISFRIDWFDLLAVQGTLKSLLHNCGCFLHSSKASIGNTKFSFKFNQQSEKVGLKLNIQKTKIIESGPITSWQIDGKKIETVIDFIFLSSKITMNSDCSSESKTIAPWKKSYDKPRQCIKNKDVTLPTKVNTVKAMVFPAVMYGFESWTIKKAEHQRIDAFKLWYWRRFLRVPWTARKLNQSILKESKLNIHWKD